VVTNHLTTRGKKILETILVVYPDHRWSYGARINSRLDASMGAWDFANNRTCHLYVGATSPGWDSVITGEGKVCAA
jgi:hypothetical protein